MTTANYIKDLLYRYDCVIVPNFGGFVTNRISARINTDSNTFYPPTKEVGFNSHLTHNDGLLANYIASVENISFEKANATILETVSEWNTAIKTEAVVLENVGSFSLNEKNQLIFSPTNTINYLTSSFGLTSFESNEIARTAEKVIPLVPVNQPRKTPVFIKYAAAAAVFLAFGYVGWTGYENKQDQLNFAKDQKQLEQKIQTATFVIESPLATIELNVDKELPKPYHVIAGAFQFTENAEKKVNQLKAKGFKAIILGKNKWGLTQVAYASFYKKTDAFKSLASVRKTDSRDAWLLVKKFD
ncbi:MAG: SPOR domain-containing protein [Flavobacteriaceae bacterium]